MTKEQEKMFVQQGDVVLVQGVVDKAHKSGDLLVWFKAESGVNSHAWIGKEYVGKSWAVAPEKPKYDPCRPFRVGDIVTPIERDGREVPDGTPEGEECTVVESEKDGIVCIRYDAGSEHYLHEIPYFHLELVTPVEERNRGGAGPYYVKETASVYEVFNRNENNSSVAIFFKSQYSIEKAKERAEEECDRLNAEHRKEQDNV